MDPGREADPRCDVCHAVPNQGSIFVLVDFDVVLGFGAAANINTQIVRVLRCDYRVAADEHGS